MASLYELTGQMLILQQLLEDPETDEQIILDSMESIDFELEEKADGYAKIIQSLKAQAEGLKAEIERLSARKSTVENNIKRLKTALEESMIALDKKKFKTDLFSFNVQKNAPSVKIVDEAKIPEQFLITQEPKVDKKGIIAWMKEHEETSTEYAELTQTESLRIR